MSRKKSNGSTDRLSDDEISRLAIELIRKDIAKQIADYVLVRTIGESSVIDGKRATKISVSDSPELPAFEGVQELRRQLRGMAKTR